MTEEQKRADAAAKKRAYRQRKREELDRQSSNEELKTMPNGQENSEIRPTHPLADEPALLADAILNSYSKDFCNTNALLTHILDHLIRIEITLQDRLK